MQLSPSSILCISIFDFSVSAPVTRIPSVFLPLGTILVLHYRYRGCVIGHSFTSHPRFIFHSLNPFSSFSCKTSIDHPHPVRASQKPYRKSFKHLQTLSDLWSYQVNMSDPQEPLTQRATRVFKALIKALSDDAHTVFSEPDVRSCYPV